MDRIWVLSENDYIAFMHLLKTFNLESCKVTNLTYLFAQVSHHIPKHKLDFKLVDSQTPQIHLGQGRAQYTNCQKQVYLQYMLS